MAEDTELSEASDDILVRLQLVSMPSVKIGFPAEQGRPELSISLHIATVWELYQAILQIGAERVAKIAMVGGIAVGEIHDFDGEQYLELQRKTQERTGEPTFYAFMLNIMQTIERSHHGKTYKDTVIGFTYDLLRARTISRDDAAVVASILLNRDPPFTSEAWRKQVDRYVDQHPELPKVEQRKPKKTKK